MRGSDMYLSERNFWKVAYWDVVEKARINGWKFLWSAIEDRRDASLSSNMFSAFWSDFLRKTLKITDPTKALYSFRHSFRDGVSACGATDYEKDQLMGHSEAGMGSQIRDKGQAPSRRHQEAWRNCAKDRLGDARRDFLDEHSRSITIKIMRSRSLGLNWGGRILTHSTAFR